MKGDVTIKVSNGDKKSKVTKKKSNSKKKNDSNKKEKPIQKVIEKTIITKKDKEMEKILIENFIAMQKVMTHMAEKFDHLTKQLSSLLDLFEDSAKALTEKEINLQLKGGEKQQEVLEKLNRVLEQNKIIAKGLTLMHETAVTPNAHYSITPPKEPQKTAQPSIPRPSQSQNQMTQSQLGSEDQELTTINKKPGVVEESNEPPQFRGF